MTRLIGNLKRTGFTSERYYQKCIQSASATHRRLDELEENQKWIWRTVVGAVITGVIAILIKFKGGM